MMTTVNITILVVNIILPFMTLSFLMSSFQPPVQPSSRHSNHSLPTADLCLLCLTHNPILNSDSYQFVNKYGRIISLSTSGVRTVVALGFFSKGFNKKINLRLKMNLVVFNVSLLQICS